MGRRPELKSDEKRDVSLLFIEILDCEHFFTAEKVLQFIGASVHDRTGLSKNRGATWIADPNAASNFEQK